ncbi:tyrosine-type recombinase/integrase [Faecalicoccus pleomorphus]|uniref:tyrosine-type recombinase/integrase n=1 Tax=Faecalicoccus pleomorphus TaxID=1323 RepID=UPI003DA1DD3D
MAIIKRKHNGKMQYAYSVYYHDLMGNLKRKHSKWFDTSKEAKREEAVFVTQNKTVSSSIKFKDAALEYIDFCKDKNTPKTIQDKHMVLNAYFKPFHAKNIHDITLPMIQDVFAQNTFKTLSTHRKNDIRSILRSIFNHAQLYYNLKSNPVTLFPKFKKTVKEQLKEFNVYTPKQFKIFLNAIPDKYDSQKALFFVLFWTGMRLNEANSLRFKDIKGNIIDLQMQFDKEWKPLKTNGSKRKIPIDKKTLDIIRSMKYKWSQYPDFSNEWFIFGGPKQLAYTTTERIKNKAIQNAELPYVRIHDFRHSHASYLIEKGVNIYKISKRLGHTSISITLDRYGHLLDVDGDEILKAIEDEI